MHGVAVTRVIVAIPKFREVVTGEFFPRSLVVFLLDSGQLPYQSDEDDLDAYWPDQKVEVVGPGEIFLKDI